MRVYEAIAGELRRQGVECVFGLMGEDVATLIIELDRLGISYVAARHENQAVGMADGYARVASRLGVAILTSGPGFTNGLTLITTASRARSPVLVIVGAQPHEDDPTPGAVRSGRKLFRYLETCAAEGIDAVKPRYPSEALTVTRRAIADASAGKTVVLNLASDLLDDEAVDEPEVDAPVAPAPLAPDPERIEVVADLLGETWAASHPLILAGRGAVASGAGPALRRLGEIVGAALATTLPARSLFAGDAFCLGVCGTFATSLGGEVFTQADPVLAFGATLNPFTTYANDLFRRTRIIQFDSDDAAFGRFIDVEPEFAIRGDARLAAEALVAELERRGTQSTGVRSAELRERIASFDPGVDFRDESLADLIDPRTLMLELHRILPRERTVVVDPGHHMVFSARYLGVTRPQDFVLPIEAGSIGVGMGPAIGAAFARPGTPCVLGAGDGGFMMALADLETAVRYSCPVVVVVSNDRALGAEVVFLESIGQPTDLARHSTPSFAAVAQALGAEGYTVRTMDDLGVLAERFQRPLRGPVVLDCYVNPQVRFDAGAKIRALVGGQGQSAATPAREATAAR